MSTKNTGARFRGVNKPQAYNPEILEAMTCFNQDFFQLRNFPDYQIIMAKEQNRPLSEAEIMDKRFIKEYCRSYAREVFYLLDTYQKTAVAQDNELYPMVSWNVIISIDNELYSKKLKNYATNGSNPELFQCNSHFAMILILRALSRAHLLYITSENIPSVREHFYEDVCFIFDAAKNMKFSDKARTHTQTSSV